jgi:hypothetical protein
MRICLKQASAMAIAGLLACFCIALFPGNVSAQQAAGGATSGNGIGPAVDWSLTGRASYQVSGDINRDLDPGSQEALLTNALEAGLILDAETKRSILSAELGVSISHFLGEDPELDGEVRIDPSVDLNWSWRDKTLSGSVSVGFDVTQASTAGDDGVGSVPGDISQFTITYATELEKQLDARNTLAVGTSGTIVDFSGSDPDLIPSQTLGLDVEWRRLLTETTSSFLEVGFRRFNADDLVSTRSLTFDFLAGLSHRRTPRHTLGGSIGVTAVRTTETVTGTDFEVGATGSASFEYVSNETTAGIDFSQSVDPSVEGSLQSFSRLDASLAYEVNDRERIEFSAAYSRRTPLGGSGDTLDFFSVGTSYVIELSDSAELTLGYLFQGNNDSALGSAFGHQAFISVANSLVLVP